MFMFKKILKKLFSFLFEDDIKYYESKLSEIRNKEPQKLVINYWVKPITEMELIDLFNSEYTVRLIMRMIDLKIFSLIEANSFIDLRTEQWVAQAIKNNATIDALTDFSLSLLNKITEWQELKSEYDIKSEISKLNA